MKQKLTWLLILQAWAMLWVVIGHAPLGTPTDSSEINLLAHRIACALFDFAYSFHMPLFIMISGYLFYMTRVAKGWRWLDVVRDKWLRLGIPYILFISLAILLKAVFPGEVTRQVGFSLTDLAMNYLQPFNGALQEMWFVAVILIYFLLYPLYPYLLRSDLSILLTLGAAVVMYHIPLAATTQWFAIDWAIRLFFFFFAGMVIRARKLEHLLVRPGAIAGFAILYVLSFIGHIQLLTALSASLAFWGLAVIIDRSLTSDLFSSFRDYTYQIFLIGAFTQIIAKILAARFVFPGSYAVWWLLCVLLGVYVPVLISRFPPVRNSRLLRRAIGL